MLKTAKNRLIAQNAAFWACTGLVSFVLPMIADSMTDGRANFLRMLAQMGPLIGGVLVSTAMLNNGITETSEK
ncbi:MAG: hypothetical protein ACR2NZ_24655 [Rubripirellula sp.]